MSKAENTTDYSKLAEKDATELHRNFAAWIEERTGYAPDLKTVQLAVTLRMSFQASEENQKHLAERRAQAEADKRKRAAEKKARLEAQLKKLQEELAAETAAVVPAAKPAARKTAAKPTAAKAAEKAPTQPRAARTRKAVASKVTPAPVPADFDERDDDLSNTAQTAAPVKRTRTRRTAATKTATTK